MFRRATPLSAGLADAPPSVSCMPLLDRISFRLRRRRPACGATLFRAVRMCACARVRAGAVRAPDCARARRRAHVSRPFRWGFFVPARDEAASGCRFLLVSSYHRFHRVKYFYRIYFKFGEKIIAIARRRWNMSLKCHALLIGVETACQTILRRC